MDHVDLLEQRPPPKPIKQCNLHTDCDAADEKWKEMYGRRANHCWTDDCEDCYGC